MVDYRTLRDYVSTFSNGAPASFIGSDLTLGVFGDGSGYMSKAIYDPNDVGADAFDYANFYGTNTPSDDSVSMGKLTPQLESQIGKTVTSLSELDTMERTSTSKATYVAAGRKTDFYWDSSDLSSVVDVRSIVTRSVASDTFSMGSVVSSNVNDVTNVITSVGHGLTSSSRIMLETTTNTARAFAVWKITQDADTAAAPGGNADNFKITGVGNSANTVFDLVGTSTMTFRILSDLTTGEAMRVTNATSDLNLDQVVYAIVTTTYQFKVANSYLNAMAGSAMTLASSTPVTFALKADPLNMMTYVPASLAQNGSAGAWSTLRREVGPEDMGIVSGVDSTHAIQAAVWLGGYRRIGTMFPAAIMVTSYGVRWLTASGLSTVVQATSITSPYNGLLVRGPGSEWCRLRASGTFPDNTDIIQLNGNRYGIQDSDGTGPGGGTLYNQGFTILSGFSIEGRGQTVGTGVNAISCQATWGLVLDDIRMIAPSGCGWIHKSSVAAGTGPADEVENLFKLLMRNVEILGTGLEGMRSIIARPVAVMAENLRIRGTRDSGMKGGFVSGRIQGVISSCGNAAGEGCVHILNAASATANESLARNLDLSNLQVEAGYDFDIYVEQGIGIILGGSIASSGSGAIATKRGLKLGSGAKNILGLNLQINSSVGGSYKHIDIASGADNIILLNLHSYVSSSILIADYASATNLHFINAPETMTLNPTGSAPVNSSFNGKPLTASKKWPRFKAENIAGAVVANVTGDGTEAVSSGIAGSVTEVYDEGGNFASGVFTAPANGLYSFTVKVAITDFSATNTSAELQLVQNIAGTPVRYMLDRRQLSSPAAADRYDLAGSQQVYMASGDTMVWSITVNGVGKTVDIVRTTNPATYQFSGALIEFVV